MFRAPMTPGRSGSRSKYAFRPQTEGLERRRLLNAGDLDTTFDGDGFLYATLLVQGVGAQPSAANAVRDPGGREDRRGGSDTRRRYRRRPGESGWEPGFHLRGRRRVSRPTSTRRGDNAFDMAVLLGRQDPGRGARRHEHQSRERPRLRPGALHLHRRAGYQLRCRR